MCVLSIKVPIRKKSRNLFNDPQGQICTYFISRGINIVNWITTTRKSTEHRREHWTAVSTLLCLISSVYRNFYYWRSNQRPQIAVPKLYNWANSSYHAQVTPNQLVMLIARPNNLNVSCKLHPYSFQRTRSTPRATSSQEA